MYLSKLAESAKKYLIEITGDCEVESLSQDSREATNKGLFFCIKGQRFDSHDFAQMAIQNGCVALVVNRVLKDIDVPQVVVSDSRGAMALMAAAFYDNPADKMRMVGITGTKGKTTTSYIVKSILDAAGIPNGLIGTTGSLVGDIKRQGGLTTPDPIDLHKTLADMYAAGVEAVCMEVSAHAIDMKRLEGITFEAACYTNFSQDHLDYFNSMEEYYNAKKSFMLSSQVKNAAINVDDDSSFEIIKQIKVPHSTYGISGNSDIFARDIEISENGVQFNLSLWNEQWYPITLHMMGMFNVYNCLAASALCLILGIEPNNIVQGIKNIRNVPGRAEVLETNTAYKVILDYSHSPAALENILKTVRSFARKKIILLFGCGGDRDHAKRPIMGKIAGEMADFTVLTSDNPRTEDPNKIISEIESGIKKTTGEYTVIENRHNAIEYALDAAKEGDIVILAGKGDETYQEIHGKKYPFNEKSIVAELLYSKRKRG
ncbi:MAG: UDP-N-acetylmuramoyl-L-alanyl-D-glutamate--2,6-diaminopimelate ligase [Eubacteriales bacterium]|nr:UDP-N-acetylmuramoyl-L-alanyl-D-glutamate--2,6-diaminopimelate ligase [Eubacteriales bacterium]